MVQDPNDPTKQVVQDQMKLVYLDNVLSAISLNHNLMADVKVPEFMSPYLRL